MKFKLDENIGSRTRTLLEEAGHDVETVYSEQLVGSSDQVIFEVCRDEGRCLITLDLDFSDVVRYPPDRNPGVIVLRFPGTITLNSLTQLVQQVINAMKAHSPAGNLWIVEPGRVRVRGEQSKD